VALPGDPATLEADLADALRDPADCVLALADRHEDNLRAALIASRLRPDVPLVVRAFDPALADEVEQERGDGALRVKRAYSMAHLAAPHFVAAALLEDADHEFVTMRVGDDYVVVCGVQIPEGRESRSSRLAGLTPADVFRRHGCQIVARRPAGRAWSGADESARLEPGDAVLLGGRLIDVLLVARPRRRDGVRRLRHGRRGGPARRQRHRMARRLGRAWARATTVSMQVLLGLLVLVTATVAIAPTGAVGDRFYLWVLTALGNPAPNVPTDGTANAVIAALGLLAGGVALGLAISLMSAHFIERQITEAAYRHAAHLRRHVIVVGLGDVGLRVCQLLDRLGVPFAVVEPVPGAAAEVTARSVRQAGGAPVLTGDLAEALSVGGVDGAAAVIACAENNLINIEACLRAKRRPVPDGVRTVARIFDDEEAARCARGLGVDRHLAAADTAATAFVDAAIHADGMRTFRAGAAPMEGVRWPSGLPVGARRLERWHATGVRLLAVWRPGQEAHPPLSPCSAITEEQAAILVGPAGAMGAVREELDRRSVEPAAPVTPAAWQ
jgi:Trk K+ transport system NAD-binding subunit